MKIKKIVLAYSGGLDTSVIAAWLQETYNAEIITYTADLGQGVEIERALDRAKTLGIKKIHVQDIRREFVAEYVFPMFRANALYEGQYLLGTAIARPLIAKKLVEIARAEDAQAIAHGATGKGNDQIRFELGVRALASDIQIIAPWREWDLHSREQMIQWMEKRQLTFQQTNASSLVNTWSIDANLLHTSYEGGELEDIFSAPKKEMWDNIVDLQQTPDQAEVITIDFEKGDPVAINDLAMQPEQLLAKLNQLGCTHGIGREDLVESRYIGMKSRGCYETPGGTILIKAHRAIESITLDGPTITMKDSIMPAYATTIYNGFWFSPEREAMQALIDYTQTTVEGQVKLELYKGNVRVLGRRSDYSLYDEKIATFEEDEGAYDQYDAQGFIRLNGLRLAQRAKVLQTWREKHPTH